MRKFIVAAALAMASPAWAIDCEKGYLWRPGDGCVKVIPEAGQGDDTRGQSIQVGCPYGVWIGGECVKGGGGGSGRVPPTFTTGTEHPVEAPSCLDPPDMVQVGDKCVAKYPDFPLKGCWPLCPGSFVTCADPSKVLVGDKCVTMTDVDDAPRIPHRSLERAPNAIYTVNGPGICLAGNTVWAAKDGKCEPLSGTSGLCDPGYALLAYPGTWTLVCARDLQAPK